MFNEDYERYILGSAAQEEFRKVKFSVWMGYDF